MVSGLRQTLAWPSRSRSSLVSSPVRSVSRMSAAPSSTASSRASSRARVTTQVELVLAGESAELAGGVAQLGAAAAQEGVDELDQPGMAADRPGNQGSVLLRQGAQGGQAQEQPAQFTAGQRRQLDRDEQPVLARQRMPAGEQQSANGGGVAQLGKQRVDRRVPEAAAAGSEVLLEVIEHQQQPGPAEQLDEQLELLRIVDGGVPQHPDVVAVAGQSGQ